MGAIMGFGQDPPKLLTQKTMTAVKCMSPETNGCRVSSEQRHAAETGNKVTKKPGETARLWARELLPRSSQEKLRDTFKWFESANVLQGLWRVEVSVLLELLGISGSRAPSGVRFFVEPTRWEHPAPKPCACDCSCKKRDDETWEQYAERMTTPREIACGSLKEFQRYTRMLTCTPCWRKGDCKTLSSSPTGFTRSHKDPSLHVERGPLEPGPH